jgi:hypothetical protein
LAFIETNPQAAMKPDESLARSLFTFGSRLAAVLRQNSMRTENSAIPLPRRLPHPGYPSTLERQESRRPFHPTRDRSLKDIKAEHEKLAMDAWRSHVEFSTTIRKINS